MFGSRVKQMRLAAEWPKWAWLKLNFTESTHSPTHPLICHTDTPDSSAHSSWFYWAKQGAAQTPLQSLRRLPWICVLEDWECRNGLLWETALLHECILEWTSFEKKTVSQQWCLSGIFLCTSPSIPSPPCHICTVKYNWTQCWKLRNIVRNIILGKTYVCIEGWECSSVGWWRGLQPHFD